LNTVDKKAIGRWIDISMPITDGLRSNHSRPGEEVRITYDVTPETDPDGRKTVRRVTTRLHAGTHVDAPEHLVLGGKRVDEIPLDTFVGRAVVADMCHRAPRGVICAADLDEAAGELIHRGDILIVRTGWNSRFGELDFFRESPVFSRDAAGWIVERGIKLVVVDFLTDPIEPDEGSEADAFKRAVLAAGIPIITNADNLREIEKSVVTLYSFPLRLVPSEAAPTRAVVWEDE
jgi:arylformamidase